MTYSRHFSVQDKLWHDLSKFYVEICPLNLKTKLDVDIIKHQILGAYSPTKAYEDLQVENKMRTMPPCKVIVRESANGKTEVAAVEPAASIQAIENEKLTSIANEIKEKLEILIRNV
jgi:uncharacterized protein (DUF302 family)